VHRPRSTERPSRAEHFVSQTVYGSIFIPVEGSSLAQHCRCQFHREPHTSDSKGPPSQSRVQTRPSGPPARSSAKMVLQTRVAGLRAQLRQNDCLPRRHPERGRRSISLSAEEARQRVSVSQSIIS
jgi:hypothetical protein